MKTATDFAEILRRPYGRIVVPEADGTYRAEIVEFPGCIASGDTASDALEALERAADSWLEATAERGLAIPEPIESGAFSGKLVVRLPKSLHARAVYAAKRDGVSLNQFIVTSVAEQIGYHRASYAASTHVVAMVRLNDPQLLVTTSQNILTIEKPLQAIGSPYATC